MDKFFKTKLLMAFIVMTIATDNDSCHSFADSFEIICNRLNQKLVKFIWSK